MDCPISGSADDESSKRSDKLLSESVHNLSSELTTEERTTLEGIYFTVFVLIKQTLLFVRYIFAYTHRIFLHKHIA